MFSWALHIENSYGKHIACSPKKNKRAHTKHILHLHMHTAFKTTCCENIYSFFFHACTFFVCLFTSLALNWKWIASAWLPDCLLSCRVAIWLLNPMCCIQLIKCETSVSAMVKRKKEQTKWFKVFSFLLLLPLLQFYCHCWWTWRFCEANELFQPEMNDWICEMNVKFLSIVVNLDKFELDCV